MALSAILPDSAGRIIIAGGFQLFQNVQAQPIARLNSDGSVDQSFALGSTADNVILAMARQPDGALMVIGRFTRFNGHPRSGIARLNANGSLDTNYAPKIQPATAQISTVSVQPDGRTLIGGSFSLVNNVSRPGLARLTLDGALDSSFKSPFVVVPYRIALISLRPDGRILLAASDSGAHKLARLNADGSADPTFNPDAKTDYYVLAMSQQSDGRTVMAGGFSAVNGDPMKSVARLNSDGTLDRSFNPGSGCDGLIFSLAIQNDGKILTGGRFRTFNGVHRTGLARLHPDGSLDSFDLGTVRYFQFEDVVEVECLAIQPDARILFGGLFTHIQGVSVLDLARVFASETPILTGARFLDGKLQLTMPTQPGRPYVLETTSAFVDRNWAAISSFNGDGSVMSILPPSNPAPQQFYRVRSP